MDITHFHKCSCNGNYCLIKTNTKPESVNYKKSFHCCNLCKFVKLASIPFANCPAHPSAIIALRRLIIDGSKLNCHYKCSNSSSWCGYTPIIIEKENYVPSSMASKSATSKDICQPIGALKDTNEVVDKSVASLEKLLQEKKKLYKSVGSNLPDKGKKLQEQIASLEEEISIKSKIVKQTEPVKCNLPITSNANANVVHHFVSGTTSSFNAALDYVRNILYVGPNNAARRNKIVSVTLDAVERLHEYSTFILLNPDKPDHYCSKKISLKVKPKSSEEDDTPCGLTVKLMEHQRQGLKWATWRENQHPAGGIIADEMGLGKTVLMLAVIVKSKQMDAGGSPKCTLKDTENNLLATGCTLIICPTSLMHHWESEIKQKCRSNLMSVILYHGPRRVSNPSRLALADVIITTYDTLRNEIPPVDDKVENAVTLPKNKSGNRDASPLLRLLFNRVVLDEGHVIKNPKTNVNQAVCRLHAKNRWVLTGTPIHNCLKDIYSLLKFLRFSPFDEEAVWRHWVDNGTEAGKSRLNSIVEAVLLRRTKNQTGANGSPLVALPLKENLDVVLHLSKYEKDVYDELLRYSQSAFKNFMEKKDSDFSGAYQKQRNDQLSSAIFRSIPNTTSMAKLLVLLLRMQQCCCHLSLLKLDIQSEDDVDDLSKMMGGMTLTNDDVLSSLQKLNISGNKEVEALKKSFPSTKVSALMDKLKQCVKSGKCVVVSQWSSYLDIIAIHLRAEKIDYCEISGRIPAKERGNIVENFNKNPTGSKVMLLSLKAGGVGLNLTGARYLFLMDIHWNPALEAQACDRIHRVGQTFDVKIFRFVCEDTVEKKIIRLHEEKLKLARNVLEGQHSKSSRLTLEDLRMLFGV